ncbi:DUF433 domain-containing protein [candidate division KSB1 bacterium]|nr:DUF433 domain-containing protein [candidate division KSB1 bacterium]
MRRRTFGQYLVADPNICHGKLTFKGTRIFVEDVLDMVSKGMDWDKILKEYRGSITREAISEAVGLASKTFITKVEKRNSSARQDSPAQTKRNRELAQIRAEIGKYL